MGPKNLPPIENLLAFEALAKLRSVKAVGEELSVTPSAITHRIRQLERHFNQDLFAKPDFSLTSFGANYLEYVGRALSILRQHPGSHDRGERVTLKIAAPPTFSRQLLLPRLANFRHHHPEIELVLSVLNPLSVGLASDVDVAISFGTRPLPERESIHLLSDDVTPVTSPEFAHHFGPFGELEDVVSLQRARLIRCPLEPWTTWFRGHEVLLEEPQEGFQFDDLGLVLDAAALGFGIGLMRLGLLAGWLETGRLIRLSSRSFRSPHSYFVCWSPGALERRECALFVEWMSQVFKPSGAH
jgi:LysR family transcriptional regulator, glycine cleavage system transcriptional activator